MWKCNANILCGWFMVCIGVSNENFSQSLFWNIIFRAVCNFRQGVQSSPNPEKERILGEDNMYGMDCFMPSLYPYSITKASIVNDIYNETESLSIHLQKKRNCEIRWRNMCNIVRLKILECTLRTLFYYSEWKQGVLTINRDSAHFTIHDALCHKKYCFAPLWTIIYFKLESWNSTFQVSSVVRVGNINPRLVLN